jgi:hypothetical protein
MSIWNSVKLHINTEHVCPYFAWLLWLWRPQQHSQYSDWLQHGWLRDPRSSPSRVKNIHFPMSSRLALGPTQHPTFRVLGVLSLVVKCPGIKQTTPLTFNYCEGQESVDPYIHCPPPPIWLLGLVLS